METQNLHVYNIQKPRIGDLRLKLIALDTNLSFVPGGPLLNFAFQSYLSFLCDWSDVVMVK